MTDTALSVLYALGAAMAVGSFSLIVRRGQGHANAAGGVLIGLIVTFPFMAAATAAMWEPGWGSPRAWGLFALAGLAGPSLGRVFFFRGIHLLGVARAVPLTSTLPLFAAALGIVFLGEAPGPLVLAGTVLIVAGTVLITSRRGAGGREWNRRHIWVPLAAVAAFSASHLFRKMGVLALPAPVLGMTVMSLAGMVSLFVLGRFLPAEHRPELGAPKAWLFYGASGVINAISVLLHFFGLRYGDLTIVVPLAATAPLWALLLSAVFLRDVERVTVPIVAGTVLVVAGGSLIAWRAI